MAVSTVNPNPTTGFHLNTAPAGFDPRREFPDGFLNFLAPLHKRFTPWQQELIAKRRQRSTPHTRDSSPIICRAPTPPSRTGASSFPSGAATSATR